MVALPETGQFEGSQPALLYVCCNEGCTAPRDSPALLGGLRGTYSAAKAMITEADFENLRTYKHDRTAMVWSLVVSALLNLLIWMLISWRALMDLAAVPAQKPQEVFMISSSSLHITHRTHPVPARPHQRPLPPARTRPQPAPLAKPRPQPPPHELARNVPVAPPQPPKPRRISLAEQLAQQEVAFSKEAHALNAAHAPLSVATADPSVRDSAQHAFHVNFSGNHELQGKGEGYLIPLRRWEDAGMHCYYGRYYWTYPTGGMEIANIPWAFCFPPSQDPIARGIHEFPFPLPLPGYRLPAGTPLQPIEADVYRYWLSIQ